MRKKQVWRYYCEFCKKANCSRPSIAHHEERCTNNPNRVCGMCKILQHDQPDLPALVQALPKPVEHKDGGWDDPGEYLTWPKDFDTAAFLADVRSRANNCPACILAALRQAKIPVPMVEGFDFEKESKSIMAEYYADKSGAYDHY